MNNRIKEARMRRGISQEEFAKKLGVTKSAISGYETGRRVPTEAIIRSICREYQINEEWLRYGKGQMDSIVTFEAIKEIAKAFNLNHFETAFLERYFSLSKDERQEFCDYLINLFGDVLWDLSQSNIDPLSSSTSNNKKYSIEEENDLSFGEAPSSIDLENSEKDAGADNFRSKPSVEAELEELKRQNQELLARMEAMEKEEALQEKQEKPERVRFRGSH